MKGASQNMSLIIQLEGGYANQHQISLNDMAILAKSIQNISKNFEIKNNKYSYTDIYINATQEGSFEILLDLLNNPLVQGLAINYLYDLLKDIKSFIIYTDKKVFIKELIDEIYALSIELAEANSYDYDLENKQQILEKKEKILNAEFSSFNSIQDISKLIKESDSETSNKPDSISFIMETNTNSNFKLDFNDRKKIHNIACEILELDDILVRGIPTHVTRSTELSFKMKVPFFGTMKIYVSNGDLDIVTDYFKEQKQITVKIKPIVKMGDLIKTREGKLIEIIGEEL